MNELTNHLVSDLMIPINDYPTLSAEATLEDAFNLLKRRPIEAANFGYRRVLVMENDGRIKGIITIPLLLKGMVPSLLAASPGESAEGYWATEDNQASAGQEVFWEEVLKSPRHNLIEKPLGDLVNPPEKTLTPDMPLARGLIYLLAQEAPILPVLEDDGVVAVLRLVDIFKLISDKILGENDEQG